MEKRTYAQLSSSTKEFLELTTWASTKELNSLWVKDIIMDACRYIRETDLIYLPLYINHPAYIIRLIINKRLAGIK